MLYAFCEDHHVNHKRLGKLIVAPNKSELHKLVEIKTQAEKNGVTDLQFIDADDVRILEPAAACAGGLLSPSTGIIDSHELMSALVAEIEKHGGAVVLNSDVSNLSVVSNGLGFECGGEVFECKTLVNAAGLWAQDLVSSAFDGRAASSAPTQYLAKGHYFALQGKSPFSHLVYPLPFDGGLGIHATNDLSGAVRFGPDVTWIDSVDYSFDESRKRDFVRAIRSYYPDLDEDKLAPAYTGIRPKLAGKGAQFTDFEIQFSNDHGVPGLVNLYGIESPGLTACLALGEYVQNYV